MSVARRLAAILSADVVGYSRLMAADAEATVAALGDCRKLMRREIEGRRGRVVDAPGDNLLAEFGSALDAVEAAVAVQRAQSESQTDVPDARRMRLRIGVSLGDVIAEGDAIYGDGVNLAARLEGLAAPGAVCVSAAVHDQVHARLETAFEDLGEQALKNFAHPVHAWQVAVEALAEPDAAVPGFEGRAAIAVLPFDNMSGDPEQEFFADGLAEDLLTQLSLYRQFPVIARNSSFVYKGRSVDVKQVSRELGCRYLVEGSVRRAGGRVRITAQLIDAETGHHVWAERYDRELDDVFAVQDEITRAIAAAMHPELAGFEAERSARRDPARLDAWECASRGWWIWHQFRRDTIAEAVRLFRRALELDPDFAWAWSGLSLALYVEAFEGSGPWDAARLEELARSAERSVALDPKDPWSQFAVACHASLQSDPERMLSAMQEGLALNPSIAEMHSYAGQMLALLDRGEEALAAAEIALRLSPRDPVIFDMEGTKALALAVLGRYPEAIEWARRALRRRSDYAFPWGVLVCALVHLDRLEEARDAAAQSASYRSGDIARQFELTLSAAAPRVRALFQDANRVAGVLD